MRRSGLLALLGVTMLVAVGVALSQPVRRLPSPIPPHKVPARVPLVRPPPLKPAVLPRALGARSHGFQVTGPDGKTPYKVTLTADKQVDQRLFDYLEHTLRLVKIDPKGPDLTAWKKHAGPGKPGQDITVTITTIDGAAVGDLLPIPPDGLELIRPGVLRVREDLAAALPKARRFDFDPVPDRPRPPPPPPPGPPPPVSGLHGVLKCRAPINQTGGTDDKELWFVKVKIGDQEAQTQLDGSFVVPGTYGPGAITLQLTYDAPVATAGLSTPLRVMSEFHDARGQDVSARVVLAGDRMSVGTVVVTGVDCEIWRLGAEALKDYQETVGRQPPDRELRLKRWTGVWDGTPYTYYDYIVLATNFSAAGRYRDFDDRRGTIFHEFGHSLRHVADGDEAHWGWDNFRWAYARFHGGCETYNVQYAFNEGWAGYWSNERGADPIQSCPKDPLFVDWTESMVAGRLRELARALSSTDAKVRAQKMVQVLEANPGSIHSLRDFELAYCRLHSAGNAQCVSSREPRRREPASCPPEFHDDGATCRKDNIRAKESYTRNVGTVPTVCGSGRELDAGLCYPTCASGYSGVGPVCWERCPSGYRDDGAFCAKPDAYGRGGGYPWEFGDTAFSLDDARDRCRRANSQGCEQDGLIWYPKCRAGFHSFGCCVCTPNCPSGMTDIGVSCAKRSYGRDFGTVPTTCSGGREYDAGLCYDRCRAGFDGVGPVCWGSCPTGWDDHGATCYREPAIIVKY